MINLVNLTGTTTNLPKNTVELTEIQRERLVAALAYDPEAVRMLGEDYIDGKVGRIMSEIIYPQQRKQLEDLLQDVWHAGNQNTGVPPEGYEATNRILETRVVHILVPDCGGLVQQALTKPGTISCLQPHWLLQDGTVWPPFEN